MKWFRELRNTLRYFVVYIAGIVLLALVSQRHSATLFLATSAALLVAAIVFHRFIRKPSEPNDLVFDIAFGGLVLAAGVYLILWWTDGARDLAGFGGAALAGFGYRTLLRQVRSGAGRFRLGGPVYMATGVALTVGAIVGIVSTFPRTGTEPEWITLIFFVMVMITGLALFTEGIMIYLKPKGTLRSITIPALAGVVVFIASIAALRIMGVGSLWVTVAALAVVLGVGSIVSETDYDVAGMVIVAAMFWALTPSSAPLPGAVSDDTRPVLVAIGDSYISGEGADTFYDGTNVQSLIGDDGVDRRNECRRTPTAYVVLIAADAQRLASVACSGALINNVTSRAQYVGEPAGRTESDGLAQLDHLNTLVDPSDTIDVVLVSIGGNDAGFAEIGSICIFPGDCTAVAQVWLDGLDGLQDRLETLYRAIKAEYPDIPVVIVPYPTPIAEIGCPSSALNASEHWFIAKFTGQLQDVIEAAASSAGVHYLTAVREVFTAAEMRVCDDGADGVNFIDLNPVDGTWGQGLNPANWIHNSLHPNTRGHEELARVIEAELASIGPNPGATAARHDVASLTALMEGRPIAACDIDACDADDPAAWGAEQIKKALSKASYPAFALATGAWLMWIAIIRWTRNVRGR